MKHLARGRRHAASAHAELVASVGMEVVRFQEESNAFDELAARILAIDRADLPCLTLLLFGGPASIDQLSAAVQAQRRAVAATVDRLQLAGYARRRPDRAGSTVELTGHARKWIERIWAPLREGGNRLLAGYPARDLALIRTFMSRAHTVQQRQARRLREWLNQPASPARKTHLRGGLSPAALRRVQVFVEASLDRSIHLAELAERADLSVYHFARAFKVSAGMTPREFVETRRIERARALIVESNVPLADVAVALGFGTQSRLTTTFKRRTGFTPAEYRRGRQTADAAALFSAAVKRAPHTTVTVRPRRRPR